MSRQDRVDACPRDPRADYDRLVDRLGYLAAKYWIRHRSRARDPLARVAHPLNTRPEDTSDRPGSSDAVRGV